MMICFSSIRNTGWKLSGTRRPLSSCASSNLGFIRDEFSRQSVTFERDWSKRSSRSTKEIMSWAMSHIAINAKSDMCLDVAAGTCIFARALSPRFCNVVALDATEAMLNEGEKQAALESISNIKFVVGDANLIPFPDNTFDVVACRLCIHHFDHAFEKVQEMARVLKPGGICVVVDIVSSNDEVEAKEQNRLEILRDNSHTKMLPLVELYELLVRSGLKPLHSKEETPTIENKMDLLGWMDSTKTAPSNRADIEKAIGKELVEGRPKTGFLPTCDTNDGKIYFIHKYAIVQAKKGVV